jgi:mercuric reductase
MARYDVIIIGGGRAGHQIANHLGSANKKVALVSLPGNFESYFDQTASVISGHTLAPLDDSPSGLQVEIFHAACMFTSPNTLKIEDQILTAEKFVLVPGVRPSIPSIPGLKKSNYQIPLDILSKPLKIKSAVVMGGGHMGVAISQILNREGIRIHLITTKGRIWETEEPDISHRMTEILEDSGISIVSHATVKSVKSPSKGSTRVKLETQHGPVEIKTGLMVMATGMIPNTDGLGLKEAGVYQNEAGYIVINEDAQTSSPRIFAAGPVCGPPFHRLLEERQLSLIENNLFAPFFAKTKLDFDPIPTGIPTDPALARMGITTKEAPKSKNIVTVTHPMDPPPGLVRLVANRRGQKLLGVHILASRAQEMILFFDLVIRAGIPLGELADSSHYLGFSGGEQIYRAIQKLLDQM